MGLFDFLQRKKATNISSSDQVSSPEFTDNELEFLAYSANHDTDIQSFSKRFFYEYKLDYNKTIKKLLDADLLAIATAEKSLKIYTVNELKNFLKQKGLSSTGSKDVLIEKIIAQTTDFHDFFTKRIYILTDLGEQFIKDYHDRMNKQLQHTVFTTIPVFSIFLLISSCPSALQIGFSL